MVVPRLAIIADDLTGALDSAAPFAGIDGGVVIEVLEIMGDVLVVKRK